MRPQAGAAGQPGRQHGAGQNSASQNSASRYGAGQSGTGQGGTGSAAEQRRVVAVRDALQAVVRGQQPPGILAPFLDGASSRPALSQGRVTWTLTADPDHLLAVRAVLAWAGLSQHRPGRLRPCANETCHLFLLDRTKGNTARWCSMAVCGNRMKARRHYQRARATP